MTCKCECKIIFIISAEKNQILTRHGRIENDAFNNSFVILNSLSTVRFFVELLPSKDGVHTYRHTD
jgi:hypothetical protein